MNGPIRRFEPDELRQAGMDRADDAALDELAGVARRLEDLARVGDGAPSAGFDDRVMAAVAAEAPPRPVVAAWTVAGVLGATRDAWRILWSGGRPMAVRAQALGLVLLVALAIGSVGTLAAVGAARLLADQTPPPSVQPGPTPSVAPPSPGASPSISPEPSPASSPSPSPSPSATASPDPTPTPPPPTSRPTDTADPTETVDPDDTPDPDDTAEPTGTDDDSSGPGGGGGSDNSGPGGG